MVPLGVARTVLEGSDITMVGWGQQVGGRAGRAGGWGAEARTGRAWGGDGEPANGAAGARGREWSNTL